MMLFRKCVTAVRALAMAAMTIGLVTLSGGRPTQAQVSIGISVNFAPPELPVYEQPLCPGEGYMWTPGYWAWDPDYGDYYWVPGTWVLAPQPGYLWTPPYWGWSGVAFIFHDGYWGPRVGFYGGINYGYGYTGRGYYGGRWERDRFYYNRNVNNINVTQIHNVYNKTVVNNINVTRVSYNGGNGGIRERANRQEEQAARERHTGAVAVQQQHIQEARTDRALRASDNHGKPPIAATDRPGEFRGGNVVAAKEGKYNPPPNRGGANNANRPGETARPENRVDRNDRPPNARGPESNANRPTYVHPNEAPKANRPDRPPTSGNAKSDQKYQQRTDNMYKKQEQDRQNLQKKQDQQHARAEQQRSDDARKQQMERQHQQQTQKMEQRQQQQQQKMERQAPKPRQQPQPKQQQPQQQGNPHDKKP